MSDFEKKLVKLLHSAAAYNDKGIFWMNHPQQTVEKLRTQWQGEISDLIQQIGECRFPPQLLRELSSPEVVKDDSGIYAQKAESWFAHHTII
jgi:hypothetical protein